MRDFLCHEWSSFAIAFFVRLAAMSFASAVARRSAIVFGLALPREGRAIFTCRVFGIGFLGVRIVAFGIEICDLASLAVAVARPEE